MSTTETCRARQRYPLKMFLFFGFDIDQMRDANPHLRITMVTPKNAPPFVTITTRSVRRQKP